MLHSILVNKALFCEGEDPNFLDNHRKIPKMTEDILLPIISPYVHKNMNKISVRSRKTAPLRERADFRGSLTAELGPWPPFFSPFSGVFSSPLEHISTRKKLLHRPWSKGTSLTRCVVFGSTSYMHPLHMIVFKCFVHLKCGRGSNMINNSKRYFMSMLNLLGWV